VQKLKEQAELAPWKLKSNDPEKPGQKRRKAYVQQEQRIKKDGKIRQINCSIHVCKRIKLKK